MAYRMNPIPIITGRMIPKWILSSDSNHKPSSANKLPMIKLKLRFRGSDIRGFCMNVAVSLNNLDVLSIKNRTLRLGFLLALIFNKRHDDNDHLDEADQPLLPPEYQSMPDQHHWPCH